MLIKKNIIQFFKFSIIGILNTLIDWIIFFLLNSFYFFYLHESISKAMSFLFAATNSFILNSVWTFKKEYQENMSQLFEKSDKIKANTSYFIKFLIVSVFGLFLNTLVFSFFRFDVFYELKDLYSKVISLFFASAIVLVWNFAINKFWTYKTN